MILRHERACQKYSSPLTKLYSSESSDRLSGRRWELLKFSEDVWVGEASLKENCPGLNHISTPRPTIFFLVPNNKGFH